MTTSQTARDFLLRRIPKRHGLREFDWSEDGCWVHHRRGSNGYAYNTTFEGKKANAYRLIYELVIGPIPEGMDLDHLCDNGPGGCVNPFHVVPATRKENALRSTNLCAQRARQTHCKQGHPLSGDNLILVQRKKGHASRVCRTCAYERTNRWRAENPERAKELKRKYEQSEKGKATKAAKLERYRQQRRAS